MAYNQIDKIKFNKKYYYLTINGNEYQIDEFYYEELLAYEGKVLEISQMLELIAFSNSSEVLKRLYKKIFNHSLSTYELKSKLKASNISDEHIKLVIDKLKELGYLKEIDFINYYKEAYQHKKGKNAFKRFLISKHISNKSIELALCDFKENEDYIYDYATNFIKNKVGSTKLIKQKLYVNLLNKGFEESKINKIIDSLDYNNEESNLKIEVKKLIKKYPDDYYKILNKLMVKGYKTSHIKNILKEEGMSNEN